MWTDFCTSYIKNTNLKSEKIWSHDNLWYKQAENSKNIENQRKHLDWTECVKPIIQLTQITDPPLITSLTVVLLRPHDVTQLYLPKPICWIVSSLIIVIFLAA